MALAFLYINEEWTRNEKLVICVHFFCNFGHLFVCKRPFRYLCTDISNDSKDISAVALFENVPFNHEPPTLQVLTYQILMLLSRQVAKIYKKIKHKCCMDCHIIH